MKHGILSYTDNANCLFVDLSIKLNKYIIYQEIHHTDYIIFSVFDLARTVGLHKVCI